MQPAKQKIARLLEQTIGLDVTSIGDTSFQRALDARMRSQEIGDVADYHDRLKASFVELKRLVEEVVVPETWFFRDQEPFIFLTDFILNSNRNQAKRTFRVLSLPCSTGEEPYSIAMTLLQAGLEPTSFFIDAVDVSERSLAIARKGVYGKNSFRTKDLTFRDTFFFLTTEGFSVRKMIREKVRFIRGNILQHGFLESLGRYDVVFCRNVLIYFNKDGQKQAINSLHNLLVPEGLLFTGHAEASLFMESRFVPVMHSKSFAFYKSKEVHGQADTQAQREIRTRPETKPVAVPKQFQRSRPQGVKSSPVPLSAHKEDEFALARRLADEGYLEEAASRSEKSLRQNGPSARWYYLLGIIRDSQGRSDEALKLLRKAVYLDPADVESLVQLSLITERAGDFTTAANYKRRAKKIRESEEHL